MRHTFGPFRAGQWVLFGTEDRVGILVRELLLVDGKQKERWDCHLVNDKGETTMVVPSVHSLQIKPARRRHIPPGRRCNQAALDRYYPE
jgi:hypothetical protein